MTAREVWERAYEAGRRAAENERAVLSQAEHLVKEAAMDVKPPEPELTPCPAWCAEPQPHQWSWEPGSTGGEWCRHHSLMSSAGWFSADMAEVLDPSGRVCVSLPGDNEVTIGQVGNLPDLTPASALNLVAELNSLLSAIAHSAGTSTGT